MLKRNIFHAKGFSLVEVIIVAALLAGLSLVVTQISRNSDQALKKLESDSQLSTLQNYISGLLLNSDKCSQSSFSTLDMTAGTQTDSYDPVGPADNTTMYAVVPSMDIAQSLDSTGVATSYYSLITNEFAPGYEKWKIDELRVYNIVTTTGNEGVCTLYYRLKRFGSASESAKRSYGAHTKHFGVQLACRIDAVTKNITYCSNMEAVSEGYWKLLNDSYPNNGINYSNYTNIGKLPADTTTTPNSQVRIDSQNPTLDPLRILVDGVAQHNFNSNGKVGIGTTAPATQLEVNGELKVGNTGIGCDASTRGALRYNSDQLEVCNSTGWSSSSGAPDIQIITGAISSCRGYSVATCPAGYTVVGGGFTFQGSCGCGEDYRFATHDAPGGPGGNTAWVAKIECGFNRAYAICIKF